VCFEKKIQILYDQRSNYRISDIKFKISNHKFQITAIKKGKVAAASVGKVPNLKSQVPKNRN